MNSSDPGRAVFAAPLPKAILFDLDDTLVSFSAGPRDYWQEAWSAHGGEARGIEAAEVSAAVDRVAGVYWADDRRAARGRMDLYRARREVLALTLSELGIDDTALCRRVADTFTELKEEAVAPFEGAIETLEGLRARGVALGLVTNGGSEFQRRKLQRYDLARFFGAVVVEGELGVGKPDPRNFREALAQLGVGPEQAWMVGDNLRADVAGAQAVGVLGIWHDHARAGLPPGSGVRPDRIVHHVAELL